MGIHEIQTPPQVSPETIADLPDQPLDEGVNPIGELSAHVAILSRKGNSMSNAIEPARPAETAKALANVANLTPMEMLNRAVAQGAGIEVLEKLMALQERWESNQARKAFDEAMSSAKSEIPTITKNRQVGFESKKEGARNTSYRHEDLAEIARTVDPILSKYGLSYRFRTKNEPNQPITVTCIVSHRDGHCEENTLQAGRDDTGNKNSIQAVGSTITYLQRYTLKAALGLAASNDDDGKRSEEPPVGPLTEEQVIQLREKIESVGLDNVRFCAKWGIESVADFPAAKFNEAISSLDSYARKRTNG
jgi:hypothetical protein